MPITRMVLVVALFLFSPSLGRAAGEKAAQPSTAPPPAAASAPAAAPGNAEKAPAAEKLVVTAHTLKKGGQVLNYRATAGCLPLKDDAGKAKADLCFVAYVKEGQQEPAARPLTFLFNGGPGASSVWLHLGAVGPKRVDLGNADKPQSPPYQAIDNDYTWLWHTDLVFIDPVGTGFSRPAAGENAKTFFGVKEDIQAVGDFIRLYTTKYERWTSAKFLAGESYGTLRAVGLADYLYETHGMTVNGLILISLALDFQTFSFERGNDLPYALFLPSYTATAWYHKKLAPGLQEDLAKTLIEAEKWALHDYTVALTLGDELAGAEREKTAETLAAYTGLSREFIEQNNLRIGRSGFMRELLRAEQLGVGLVDSRATHHGRIGDFQSDPGVVMTIAPYTAVLNHYLRHELKFESDLPYIVLNEDANGQWNWGSAIHGYVSVIDTLHQLLTRHPHLKVFAACGWFDLDTPWLGAKYSLNHLGLNPELQANISFHTYEGGHMLYTQRPSLEKLATDVEAFLKTALTSGR